ncbi:MAG: AIM24 family protein [Thermoguttaceae bacterium]|nr:AIM24 family protein [Thermoguttaceae bacterium]
MNIEIEYQGRRQVVTSAELFRLAASGELQPSTRLWLDGKETNCGNVKGIVFGAPQTPAVANANPFAVDVPGPEIPTYTSTGPQQNRRFSTPYLDYMIAGGSTPYVMCYLNSGQATVSPSGGRVWMKGMIGTQTNASGGFLKSLGRMVAGETFFLSHYVASGPAEIAFATKLPGMIVPRVLGPGESVICQRGAFLAASPGVELSVFWQKKLSVGLFGGDGFIMQRATGPGIVFLELDGAAFEYDLAAGEQVICDTGAVAWMDSGCSLDIQMVKGVKNILFGGEGLFNTTVTGPGKVTLQSMSVFGTASKLAPIIYRLIPHDSNGPR